MSLSTVLVVLGTLAGITAFGVRVGRRDRTVAGFFLAGRGDSGFRQGGLGFAPGRTAGSLLCLPAC